MQEYSQEAHEYSQEVHEYSQEVYPTGMFIGACQSLHCEEGGTRPKGDIKEKL